MNKQTNRIVISLAMAFSLLILVACGSITSLLPASSDTNVPEGMVLVEIAYLNHGPVRSVLTDIDSLLAKYDGELIVNRYDFASDEGEIFAEERDLSSHTPLAIYVNGQREFDLDGRSVEFYSFPQGQGTGVVPDGSWTLDDLQIILNQVTGR